MHTPIPAHMHTAIPITPHCTHVHQRTDADTDVEVDEEVSIPFPDLMDSARYFEQGGVSGSMCQVVSG